MRDEDGFYEALLANHGIEKTWVEWKDYADHDICICPNGPHARDVDEKEPNSLHGAQELPTSHPGHCQELDLLPDVAIAEEARDSLPASQGIYDLVINSRNLYRVMDDYNLCLFNEPESGAFMNGDTCVRSTLDKRQSVHHEIFPPPFDITEDWSLGADGTRLEERAIPSETLALLYAPLPRHLPTVDKDILILMAALTGNIDRYIRLKRPRPINGEMQCIVRGIYHNAFFAKWCYEQPELAVLQKFVHARFIMNDDLTWLNNERAFTKDDVPRIIWYPQTANRTTYLELLRLIPELKQLVAQALVVSDSPTQFARLEPEITPEIYAEIMNGARSDAFQEYLHQRLSNEEEEGLAECMELPHHVHDVAPYDHLVSKEMKPWFAKALKEVTLDDVGFENREVYEPDTRDARDLVRYMSAFPTQSRDHYREGRDATMRA
ncbi:hypothetical protein FPCIR_7156 [Fusarium pseudocircinatum]|uniref:Uncharacterized protein n=1 Tax=Fusarium pseudocircinatum TaxID=56676 RepID=A0A8H5P4Z7_9HYPO|nr:hypothetical protein FPCIR_7156 [Fusarium pseudocircinatum]